MLLIYIVHCSSFNSSSTVALPVECVVLGSCFVRWVRSGPPSLEGEQNSNPSNRVRRFADTISHLYTSYSFFLWRIPKLCAEGRPASMHSAPTSPASMHSASTTTSAQRSPSVGADAERLPKAWRKVPAVLFKKEEHFPRYSSRTSPTRQARRDWALAKPGCGRWPTGFGQLA